MYPVFSKSFAKSAVDLNKKGFYDDNKGLNKVTAKGKAGGTSYEVNTNIKGAGDAKVTMPVDDKCSVSIKTTTKENKEKTGSVTESEVECAINLGDGIDLKLIANDPDIANLMGMKVNGELDYKTAAFSVEGKFCKTGASAAITTDCPGLDGVVLGLNPGYGTGNKGAVLGSALGWKGDGMELAGVCGLALIDSKPVVTNAGLRGSFKVTDSHTVAFQADQATFKMGKNAHDSFKAEASQTLALGCDYKISGDASAKVKATYGKADSPIEYDFSYKTALAGKSNLIFNCKGLKDYSFVYTIEN